MTKLVGATGDNGYFTALERAFGEDSASPSAFCQFRTSISYIFFQDLYQNEVKKWEISSRAKYKGLFINAIDGDRFQLPCSEKILNEGYRGTPVKDNQETYYPTMYYCCGVDAITGVPIGFSESSENDEIARAIEIMESYEATEKTVTIFDRFYFCTRLLEAYQNGGYFLARCKTGGTFKEITEFAASSKRDETVVIEGLKCRLTRFTVPGADEETILITNLPNSFKISEVHRLYGFRWESETNNRDRTTSMKIEQFRSKNLNSIRQEIYMSLILQATAQIACAKEIRPEQYFMKEEYIKANFKVVFTKIFDHFDLILSGLKKVYDLTKKIVIKTKQKRNHFSRSYERVTKQPTKNSFKRNSLVSRRN